MWLICTEFVHNTYDKIIKRTTTTTSKMNSKYLFVRLMLTLILASTCLLRFPSFLPTPPDLSFSSPSLPLPCPPFPFHSLSVLLPFLLSLFSFLPPSPSHVHTLCECMGTETPRAYWHSWTLSSRSWTVCWMLLLLHKIPTFLEGALITQLSTNLLL